MNIAAIETQPDQYSLLVAYRPIYFNVLADSLVPPNQPMYADVYFKVSGSYLFYKTFTSFSITSVATNSIFEFDIQDALQEYLTTYIPTITLTNIINATIDGTLGTQFSAGGVECKVLFRGSTITSGVLSPNPTVPIQGTSTTAPVSGTGTASNEFVVINSTLAPNYIWDQNALNGPEDYLASLLPFTPLISDQRIYGLSNLPVTPVTTSPNTIPDFAVDTYAADHGGFPLLILDFGTYGSLSHFERSCSLYLDYWTQGAGTITEVLLVGSVGLTNGLYYLPVGLQEILLLTSSATVATMVNPAHNTYYRLRLIDNDAGGNTIFDSPVYRAKNKTVENKRLWFQNYWGHFEQVSFVRNAEQFKTVSSEQFRPYLQDNSQGNTQYTGRQRYNVRIQSEKSFTGVFPEALMPWLKEMMGSPFVFLDVPTTGTEQAVMPCFKVSDDTFTTRKTIIDGRFWYEITVKLVNALDVTTIRN